MATRPMGRSLADKLDAKVKCAWFPYLCQSNEDCRVLKTLSYYKHPHHRRAHRQSHS